MSSKPSLSRRGFIGSAAAAATAALAGCMYSGGGSGGMGVGGDVPVQPSVSRDQADVAVSSAAELEREANRGNGQVVWIEDGAEIDMTGRSISVRDVAIAGGRRDDYEGPLVYTEDHGHMSPAFRGGAGDGLITLERNARISGIRLRGPSYDYYDSGAYPGFIPYPDFGSNSPSERTNFYRQWHSRGVTLLGDSTMIDNSEVFGFSTHGIVVGDSVMAPRPTISSCVVHNCMQSSQGYCIDVKRGMPTISGCYFDAARHVICGFGHVDCGYHVQGCYFGPHNSGHVLDMHRLGQNLDSTSSNPESGIYKWRAGGTMIVEGCRFHGTTVIEDARGGGRSNELVHVRGVPLEGFLLRNNVCEYDSPLDAIRQTGVPPDTEENQYGYVNVGWESNQFAGNISE